MTINSISFSNYKAFVEEQILELKPLTILIGKNSSGKSAIAKLFMLLQNSLSQNIDEPLRYSNENVSLGSDFRDLAHNRLPKNPVVFGLYYNNNVRLKISIVKENEIDPTLRIYMWQYNEQIYHYNNEEKCYVDNNGNKYQITFKGFIPVKFVNEQGNDCLDGNAFLFPSMNVDYIGPFRVLPERIFTITGQLEFPYMGIKGENAYSSLAVSKLQNSALHTEVGKWYEKHFDGWSLNVEDKLRPYFELRLIKGETEVNIVDVGQGMNQALPLVVRSFIKKLNSIVILEQPELHLHPAAHGDLAELFAQSAKQNGQTFIIETHSENLILRIRRLIVEGKYDLTASDMVIYWVTDSERGGQYLEKITINEEGVLSDWPEGVFTEDINEIVAMRKALKRKRETNDTVN